MPNRVPFSPTVAIIGGGFSGSMLAVHLLRQSGQPISVVLIERSPEPGRGVAYATNCRGHLLNVRARNMSAYADDPDHFARWAQSHVDPSVHPDDYLPRQVYAQYVMSQVQSTARDHSTFFRCIQDEAVSLTYQHGYVHIVLASGQSVSADKVVLAVGNFPPTDAAIPEKGSDTGRFICNPWASSALAGAQHEDSVLLLGSGLTSVDVAIELRARGFRGKIYILSRRGLLPQRHRLVTPLPTPGLSELPRTAGGLLRLLRVTSAAATQAGRDWRCVIDSLRPLNQQIWRSLPLQEQRRFLRHLRPYWDVHRHRIAPPVADQLAAEIAAGAIEVHAGRLMSYREYAGTATVTYRKRNGDEAVSLEVSRVVNCTGPESDLRKVNHPLLADLFKKGMARPDALRLGLDVSETGGVLNARGRCSKFLFAVGPLRKGQLWETVAVPELREQIAELAELLVLQSNADIKEPSAVGVGPED